MSRGTNISWAFHASRLPVEKFNDIIDRAIIYARPLLKDEHLSFLVQKFLLDNGLNDQIAYKIVRNIIASAQARDTLTP